MVSETLWGVGNDDDVVTTMCVYRHTWITLALITFVHQLSMVTKNGDISINTIDDQSYSGWKVKLILYRWLVQTSARPPVLVIDKRRGCYQDKLSFSNYVYNCLVDNMSGIYSTDGSGVKGLGNPTVVLYLYHIYKYVYSVSLINMGYYLLISTFLFQLSYNSHQHNRIPLSVFTFYHVPSITLLVHCSGQTSTLLWPI